MKKILAMVLALIFALSLCACGGPSDGGTGGNSTPSTGDTDKTSSTSTGDTDKTLSTSTNNNSSDDGASSDNSQGTGYVGTWKVIPPDDNPFPPLFLVLNEDGTAGWGAKLDNLSPRIWYECDEADAKEGQMELSREDNKGYGDDFYLTEDGKIYMEVNLSVGENSYDHIFFERQ